MDTAGSLFLPARQRVHRKRRPAAATGPAVVGPVLVSAEYDGGADPPVLTLTFDRAVDVSGLDGAAIVVNDDPGTGQKWLATNGVSQPDATSVALLLTPDGFPEGAGLWVTATGANGIVAVDGGEAWAGVTELGLPFP